MVKNLPNQSGNWKEEVVKNFFRQSNRQFPANYIDPAIQHFNGPKVTTDTTIQNFDGGVNSQGVIPPDTYGDVGPNYYFQIVNMNYSIFDKTGSLLLNAANTTIWSGMPNNYNGGDGVVNYDEQADRWLVTQLSYTGNQYWQMVAVSQTSDPTGSWYRYQYAFNTTLPDYPKWGVWPDGYYFSFNRFAGGANYDGIGVAALDRSAMLAGNSTAQMVEFDLAASDPAFTALPGDCDGEFPTMGTPEYFTYMNPSPCSLGIYEFHADFTTPSNSTFGNFHSLPVTTFNDNQPNIPENGTTHKLDAIPDRLMYRCQYRKFSDHESMVLNHTVNAGSNVAGVRWYELRKTTGSWTVYQQSTYSPDGNCRWMGSIAMDTAGNIALGFSESSSSMYPAIKYTGRLKNDPLNTMTIAEKGIYYSGGAQTSASSRWGDYSSMTCDANAVFWYTQEYYASTSGSNWKTRIASFSFANILSLNLTATPGAVCQGDTSQLQATVTGGSGTYTYAWTSIPAGFTDTVPNPVVTPLSTTQYICEVSDGTNSKSDTIKVTVNPQPVVFAGNDTTIYYTLLSYQLNAVDSNCWSLRWGTLGDGTFDNEFILNPVYSTSWQERMAGSFTVTLTGFPHPPCTMNPVDSITVTFTPAVGIAPVAGGGGFDLQIFPNPAHTSCSLVLTNLQDAAAMITLTDLSGRQVYSEQVSGPQKSVTRNLDLSTFDRGIYFVRVKSASELKVEKLVIN
ncbi:MAG TPA: T9SS type A sorting domain-containing protein [Bacteroidales bacterium]|nr:T9SS type A sorting domain-containing protein [Bacteroidales bacterium]